MHFHEDKYNGDVLIKDGKHIINVIHDVLRNKTKQKYYSNKRSMYIYIIQCTVMYSGKVTFYNVPETHGHELLTTCRVGKKYY